MCIVYNILVYRYVSISKDIEKDYIYSTGNLFMYMHIKDHDISSSQNSKQNDLLLSFIQWLRNFIYIFLSNEKHKTTYIAIIYTQVGIQLFW